MWERIKRFFSGIFGGFFSTKEDPRKALERNIREMRDRIPEINEGIVKARIIFMRLESRGKEHEAQINSLTARIKACITAGDDEMGAQLAVQLKRAKEDLDKNMKQHEEARSNYEHMTALKEKFILEIKTKNEEAMRAIQESEAARWKTELAGVFKSFETSGAEMKHRKMIDKLEEQAADADAKLRVAKDLSDMKSFEMQKKAEKIEGMELLNKFKIEMGLQEETKSDKTAANSKDTQEDLN